MSWELTFGKRMILICKHLSFHNNLSEVPSSLGGSAVIPSLAATRRWPAQTAADLDSATTRPTLLRRARALFRERRAVVARHPRLRPGPTGRPHPAARHRSSIDGWTGSQPDTQLRRFISGSVTPRRGRPRSQTPPPPSFVFRLQTGWVSARDEMLRRCGDCRTTSL